MDMENDINKVTAKIDAAGEKVGEKVDGGFRWLKSKGVVVLVFFGGLMVAAVALYNAGYEVPGLK
jgi:hypothetical protein